MRGLLNKKAACKDCISIGVGIEIGIGIETGIGIENG